MQDKIGLIIAKGLSVVYKEKPKNPTDFFAKWLLSQSEIQKKELEELNKLKEIDNLKLKNEKEEQDKLKKEQEKLKKKQELDKKVLEFRQ